LEKILGIVGKGEIMAGAGPGQIIPGKGHLWGARLVMKGPRT